MLKKILNIYLHPKFLNVVISFTLFTKLISIILDRYFYEIYSCTFKGEIFQFLDMKYLELIAK